MGGMYTCECKDGKTITGGSRWELSELKRMSPLQLAQVLTELRDFARYYEATFFYPIQSLRHEIDLLQTKFDRVKVIAVICGIVTGVFTLLWLILAVLPVFRFSGLTLLMAVLTLVSILIFIPVLFRFVSTQEDVKKRLPRIDAKLEKLLQKQEKEIYGTYVEYLIGGYLISPEYSLSDEALDFIIRALSSRQASNLSEATLLCKKKYGRSPVPRLIASVRSMGDPTAQNKEPAQAARPKMNLSQMEGRGPDLQTVMQLSEYLHAAIQGYAASQPGSMEPGSSASEALSSEELKLIKEYRYLKDDEKKRIARIVHSFHTRQI